MDKLKKEIKELYGCRTKDGACSFCGETLSEKEYCYCPGAMKVNAFFKRAGSKFDNLFLWKEDEGTRKFMLKAFFKNSGVPIKYSGLSFDDYKEYEPTDAKVKKAVLAYFNDAIKNYFTGKCLILYGNPGTGKTMLMSTMTENLIREYMFSARCANCVELINEIQDTYSGNTPRSTLSVLDKYRDADFLLLDDLDKINATPDARKLVYSLINDRYERCLPIIISFNCSIEELDANYFKEPTVSRILERSTAVHFTQKNKRF